MTDTVELSYIARRIRALRNARGQSQDELARLAGCHRSLVSQVERAVRNLSVDTLDRFATAMGVDAISLFYDREVQRNPLDSTTLRERVSLNVLALRSRRGLSQDALSRSAGLSSNYVSSLEVHKPNVDLAHLGKLAQALDIPVRDFFTPDMSGGPLSGLQ